MGEGSQYLPRALGRASFDVRSWEPSHAIPQRVGVSGRSIRFLRASEKIPVKLLRPSLGGKKAIVIVLFPPPSAGQTFQ